MRPFVILAALSVAGCASVVPLPRQDLPLEGRIITREMIATTSARTAWDVVKSTGMFQMSEGSASGSGRPLVRGRRGRNSILIGVADMPLLIVDGTRMNDAGYLYAIPASTIETVRILNGIDGSAREGLNSGAGVIYITRRSGA